MFFNKYTHPFDDLMPPFEQRDYRPRRDARLGPNSRQRYTADSMRQQPRTRAWETAEEQIVPRTEEPRRVTRPFPHKNTADTLEPDAPDAPNFEGLQGVELCRAVCAWLMATAPKTDKDADSRLVAGEERVARLVHTLATAGLLRGTAETAKYVDDFCAFLQARYFDGITTDEHGAEACSRARHNNRLIEQLCTEQNFGAMTNSVLLPHYKGADVSDKTEVEMSTTQKLEGRRQEKDQEYEHSDEGQQTDGEAEEEDEEEEAAEDEEEAERPAITRIQRRYSDPFTVCQQQHTHSSPAMPAVAWGVPLKRPRRTVQPRVCDGLNSFRFPLMFY